MKTPIYWIWLQQALGVGAHQSEAILHHYDSAQAVYEDTHLPTSLMLTPSQHRRLTDKDLSKATREWERLQEQDAWVLTPEDDLYTSLFEGMYAPPMALYAKGQPVDTAHAPTIAIVGTRFHDENGRRATRRLAAGLAASGAVIVSGGAEGLDSEALDAALRENGTCISFQACGIDVDYPRSVSPLRQRLLAQGGLLLSEFPLGSRAHRHHFRIRNRLISAVSDGTLVTQAPLGSGALITAEWAREQGKDVYAVPGSVGVSCSEGSNELLKDGAGLVTNAADILMDYLERYPFAIDIAAAAAAEKRAMEVPFEAPENAAVSHAPTAREPMVTRQVAQPCTTEVVPCPVEADEAMRRVYASLKDEPKTVSELARALATEPSDVLSALTELELYGTVSCQAGQRYALCPATV